MYDLVIAGGALADLSGLWDIGVSRGKIAAVEAAGALAGARATLDARGRVVLPGLVDAHVHARDPGQTHKEDFASLTKAAAAGGVTTVMAMPNSNPPLTTAAAIRHAREKLRGNHLVNTHLVGGACMDMPARIASLAGEGVIAIDVFDNAFAHGSARWAAVFREAARTRLPLCFYLQDSVQEARTRKLLDKTALSEVEKIARTSDGLTECAAIGRIVPMAALFDLPVVLRMVSTGDAVDLVRHFRQQFPQVKVIVETCVHYLFLTTDELAAKGAAAHIHPPLRSQRDVDTLWKAVADGTIDYIATDHAPHAPAEKNRAALSACATGIIGLETMLPLLLDACARGRLAMQDIVRLCCENPARAFGLYPQKGALRVGSDADLTIVDPQATWRIDGERFRSRGDKGPFVGREVAGRVCFTAVGGEVVLREGEIEWKRKGE